MPLDIHLVSHTHWDREWYRTAEEFRQRLVDLVDELIDDPPPDGQSFLLDGQAIVVEDYLDVRPGRRDQLRGLLSSGRVEAGPWYVLADELIPTAESLVRNLLIGRRSLEALGATSPPVLYCPDSFGHPASLPELAAGFGLPLIILWRGYGGKRWPQGDAVRWTAPSGTEAFVFHLPPDGYEFGSSLPSDRDAAQARWKRIREVLAGRSTVGVTLVQNGADHHARQRDRSAALDVLSTLAEESGDRLRVGSLRGFAEAFVQRARAQRLPAVSGELRDSYGYTWALQGTFATRAAQKRANAIAERELLAAEMWSAAALLADGRSRGDLLRAGWKTLLAAHPHDTLCGTSIDEVASAMDVRIRSATVQGASLEARAVESLVGHDASTARESGRALRDVVVVQNGAAYERGGVALIEYVEKLADEPVGPGSGGGPRLNKVAESQSTLTAPKGTQVLGSAVTRDRIEGARHYPDNDIVRRSTVACWVKPVGGVSVRVTDALGSEGDPLEKVRAMRDGIASANLKLTFDKVGTIDVSSSGRVFSDLVRFDDRVDEGDLYTPSIRDVAATAKLARQSVTHRGPLIGEMRQEWNFEAGAARRGTPRTTLQVSFRVVADSPLLELRVEGDNQTMNHRLRIGLATGLKGSTVVADAMFGPVERKAIAATDDDRKMETPPATALLHRYVSLFSGTEGATIHSDGLAEYEVDDEGIVWVTLVRAVGQLSRNDLPERPGHAGWPVDTPGAQSIGRFEARLALQLHGASSAVTLAAIERESDRFLHPLRGFTLRATDVAAGSVGGIEISGVALAASAIKESEDGRRIVLRCINLSDREQRGAWRLAAAITGAHLARLDETPLDRLEVQSGSGASEIPFTAGPRAVVTILVEPERSDSLAKTDRRRVSGEPIAQAVAE